MNDLREIVDTQALGKLFTLLAVLVPLLAATVGGAIGKRNGNPKRGATNGLTVGLLAPLNWVLWRLYNAVVDSTGIDTVRNVLINLVLFVAIGLGVGIGVGNWKRKHDAEN